MTPKAFATIAAELKPLGHKQALEEARRQIEFIDSLVALGEEPYEIEYLVHRAAQINAFLFFGCLVERHISPAPELLMQMVEALFEHVYLVERRRRATLANASKTVLKDFICLVEFVTTKKAWDQGANPFDGLLNFYRYLEETGYRGSNVPRRERAVAELRRTIPKEPCTSHQKGYELAQ